MRTKRRCFLRAAGGLALASAAGRANAQGGAIELVAYLTAPAAAVESVRLFADRVTERAAGKLAIDVTHRPGLSVPVTVLGGISPLSYFLSIQGRDASQLFALSSLPMVASSFDEAQVLLDVARPYYDAALARFDLSLLAADPWRPPALWSSKPLETPRDLSGATFSLITMAHTAGWGRMFERLGTRHSPFSAQIELSWGGRNTERFEPVFQFFTEIFLASQLNFLVVGRKFLAERPAAEREALVEAGRLAEAGWWKAARELMVRDQREIAGAGCQVTSEPTKELQAALREAAEPDIQRWVQLAGPTGAELLATYRARIGR